MFNTIVVGTDGSANAEDAIREVAAIAQWTPDSTVHVVAACRPLSPRELSALTTQLPEEFHSAFHGDMGAESILASARSILNEVGAGATVEFHQINDSPAEALLDAVESYRADLLVVGSRGEGRARRALNGSVSTSVLHHAPCSVLVVKASG
ncbi:MAG: universal stress protein [Actinomycetia bacterium]|nr:universal stress protein [Actinomycetes bacterium]